MADLKDNPKKKNLLEINNMTIAEQLKVKDFPFEIKDSNNNRIYFETLHGDWNKKDYDSNNNVIFFINSDGYWIKKEYDSKNNVIYSENSDGEIEDNRLKSIPEYTIEQLQEMLGKEFKIIK